MKTNIQKYITHTALILFMFLFACSETEMSGDPVVPGTEKITISYAAGSFACDWPADVAYADLWIYDSDSAPTFPDGSRVDDATKIVACAFRINVNGAAASDLMQMTQEGKLTTIPFTFGTGRYYAYILGWDSNNHVIASSPAIILDF